MVKRGAKKLTLPTDATVASVLPGLVDPKKYVRFVLEKMHETKSDQVRVSVCGSVANPPFILEIVIEDEGCEHWLPNAGYRGASRAEMDEETVIQSAGWSDAAMSLHQIKDLMGVLNNWKGVGAKPDA